MTFALIFPGQGSQSVGMGKDIAEQFPEAQAVFDEVDEALGEKLSSLIWDGPHDQLTMTANTQPALMAVSLATIRAMESKGFHVDNAKYVAGHSLGEYSALAASGALSIADTARLLRIRGNAMQKAVPVGVGAMAAIIGLENDVLEDLCTENSNAGSNVQIANDNGGGQLVVSGHKEAVDAVCDAAKKAGAKRAILLPVSAPFHSVLMAPAAEAMHEALAEVEMTVPVAPLITNVLATPVSDPDEIKKHLVEQVTGRVRWQETIAFMAGEKVDVMLEAGAGKVLTGLSRRIDRALKGQAINTPDDISSVLESIS